MASATIRLTSSSSSSSSSAITFRERQRESWTTSMASATIRLTFSFHRLHSIHPMKKPSQTHLLPSPKRLIFPARRHLAPSRLTICSVEVSKEDKPLSQPEEEVSSTSKEEEDDDEEEEEEPLGQLDVDPRRFEEKFAVLNTGIYECRSCGYRYDEAVGDPSYPIPPGLQFAKLPEDWRCPTCGAAKSFFESKSVEIAGFAENQQFGLGGNTLTSGQKALLIYGSLFLAFALFLSGYFLQ
ncbi:uncharacterized protein [Typha angustifolia]|uniref:uncharacterized protein n=1 Tax=Typha angustifolia TaxID=59011 RepID=UPI003C2FC4A5